MAQRIVSLVPAATELICALGLRRQLVGRSHACDTPEAVRRLPALTLPGAPAGERGAQALLAQQLAPYATDAPALIALQPDHIVTHPRADLPGFSLDELKRAMNSLMVSRPQLHTLQPATLADVYNGFQKLADALGAGQQGKALVQRIRRRADQVAERARGSASRPRVLVLSRLAPLHTTGWWVPTLIEAAGGAPVLAPAGAAPPLVTWREVAVADPDVIILAPEAPDAPAAIGAVPAELALLLRDEAFRSLRAYRSKRVVRLAAPGLLHRPGPRLLDALEVLAEVCHPQQFGIRRLGLLWTEVF